MAAKIKPSRFEVRFEFFWEGEWKRDFLSNNGNGFSERDADYIARELNERENIRGAHYDELRSCFY